jgi:hypothetical protein
LVGPGKEAVGKVRKIPLLAWSWKSNRPFAVIYHNQSGVQLKLIATKGVVVQ